MTNTERNDAVPVYAAACCEVLRQAGFEAYPVGGCVRDLLLGRVPDDWDIATSAWPEQVMGLFPKTIPTGFRHGTVTVLLPCGTVEVTTFRSETGYADGRHPDCVRFVPTLEEDLSRRDFTVNAMALAPDGSVIDLFGGQADLAARCIRCVGNADERFSEDALRMVRAARFAAQLDFSLDAALREAVFRLSARIRLVSAERIQTETKKLLCSAAPERGGLLLEANLLRAFLPQDTAPVSLAPLTRVPAEPLLRWAGFCALLNLSDPASFLRALRLDGKTVLACQSGNTLLRYALPADGRSWRHGLYTYGADGCRAAAAMAQVLGTQNALDSLARVLAAGDCVSIGDLAVSGGDLIEAFPLSGPAVGLLQKRLLLHVLDFPEDNRRDILLALAAGWSREEAP